ncbi:hypothetical protein BYT27DRAFT_7205032 [Phlegmacium glaucopus]|nr:hypothetical protein BYT27DRAFT_7205032 [Phlegmacium glaucopus]
MEVLSENNVTALDSVQSFLQQILRITTVDSRIFIGTFAGTDKPLNIILINAEEYHITRDLGQEDGRYVGQVLLPWKMIAKVEVHRRSDVREGEIGDNMYL